MSEFTEILRKNTNWEEFEFKEENPYKRNLKFGDELDKMAEDIRTRFEGNVTVTTAIYGMTNIKVRSKGNIDEFMNKLDELGRFKVFKRDLGSVIIYDIYVKRNKYY